MALVCVAPCVGAVGEKRSEISAPKNIETQNHQGGVMVTWDRCSNVDGYVIYRSEGNVKKRIARINNGNQKMYVDKTVVSGGKYNYTVSAYIRKTESVESGYSRIIHLDTPVVSSISVVNGGILLNWKNVNGAKSYVVYRSDGKNNGIVAEIKNSDTTSFKDITVLQDVKYKYTVVAKNAGYKSGYKYKVAPVYVVAPRLKSVTNANGYITVSWYHTFKADGYKIYRKTNNSAWVLIGTSDGKNNYLQDKSVVNGEVYTYTIRAVKNGSLSGFDGNGVKGEYVSVPSNIKVFNRADCLNISWNSVQKAKKYFVYRKDTKNTGWKLIGQSNTDNFSDNSIENGVFYTYTVRAEGSNGGLSWFLSGSSSTALKAPGMTINCVPDAVILNWTKLPTATEYYVYRKTQNAKNWSLLCVVKGSSNSSVIDTNVKKGEKYTYTVKQVKDKIAGSYNVDGISTKFYPGPDIILKYSPVGVLITWSKAPVGLGYEIERMTESDKQWKKCAAITNISTTQYQDSGASYGENNYYRIKVKDSDLMSYTTSIFGIDPNKPAVALTYDDGPYSPVTNRILDVLEKYDSRATFFVVGSRVNTYADCIKREVALGCEIANHTYNHKILTSANNDVIKNEIQSTNQAIKKLTGKSPVIVRAPGGSYNQRVKGVVGYPFIQWSVDTLDWKNSSGVVSTVKNNVRDGSIILMHDLYGTTASATETLVPWLVNQGYQLVTVTELMELNGIYMEPGKVYFSAN